MAGLWRRNILGHLETRDVQGSLNGQIIVDRKMKTEDNIVEALSVVIKQARGLFSSSSSLISCTLNPMQLQHLGTISSPLWLLSPWTKNNKQRTESW